MPKEIGNDTTVENTKTDNETQQPQSPRAYQRPARGEQAGDSTKKELQQTASSSSPSTPEKKPLVAEDGTDMGASPSTPPSGTTLDNGQMSSGEGSRKSKYKGKGIGPNGKPRNFYNPPSKVMRQLSQQSYYDNFYGNQAKFYTLRQKYKTQMCKHFVEDGDCPLKQYCQFAHGPDELRQPNDPLPKNFGKTALGAVHSNYKTEPCKNWMTTGECKFGDGCSFFHSEEERRRLIDPLPNLPEGVTLPPMPEKLKKHKSNQYYKQQNGGFDQNQGQNMNSNMMNNQMGFTPMPAPMIQITNWSDLAALGGFNPNKYLMPGPIAFGAPQPFNPMGYPAYQPNPMMNQANMNGQAQANGAQPAAQTQQPLGAGAQQKNAPGSAGKKGQSNQKNGGEPRSPTKANHQRYEKKSGSAQGPKSGKKDKALQNSDQKRYVSKQKDGSPSKTDSAPAVAN